MTVTLDLSASSFDQSTRRSLEDLSLSVSKCKKIVVVTGAGISCSSGIPDFRSSDGLYALVKQRYPNVVMKGRDLFDASLFRDTTTTSVFYTFISQLKQSVDSAQPTPTHNFIKLLDFKGRLLRSYTQNIDGLEERAGLLGSSSEEARTTSSRCKTKINAKDVRNVQLHGDIHRVRCIACSADYLCTSEHITIFNEGLSPPCPDCTQRSEARVARSARPTKVGTLRPAIVLYDEPHPLGDDIGSIQGSDVSKKPDLLIIMGTSLKVHGLKKLVKDFAKAVHSLNDGTSKMKKPGGKVVFVNKTAPGSEWADIIDYHVLGETDEWVSRVEETWRKRRPQDWEFQTTLDNAVGSSMKVVKANGGAQKLKGKADHRDPEVENVPPAPSLDMILSSPDFLKRTTVPDPSSPTKRRQVGNHYDDGQSSPTKRRPHRDDVQPVKMDGPGLLFADKNHVSPPPAALAHSVEKIDLDSKMHSPARPKIRIPPAKAVKEKKVATRASARRRQPVAGSDIFSQ